MIICPCCIHRFDVSETAPDEIVSCPNCEEKFLFKDYLEYQPRYFLAGYHDVCDPPFCFRCGKRRGYCECPEGPASKTEWMKYHLNRRI